MTETAFLYVVLGYFLGSIPFGLVLTKLAGMGDVRKIGSGNIGATNVLRTGNKGLAAVTLLLDGLKGLVPVLIAGRFAPEVVAMAGAAAFLGHVFPVWLGFKGGKGVATFMGVLLALSWPTGLAAIAVWVSALALFRYSSLSSLLASAAAPVMIWAFETPPGAFWSFDARLGAMWVFVMTVVVFVRHRDNIKRLIAGQEPRVGGASQK